VLSDIVWFPFFVAEAPTIEALWQTNQSRASPGHLRTGQAENWGRPSGGADFLLERPGDGFSVPVSRP
jgi:hypothetical protein